MKKLTLFLLLALFAMVANAKSTVYLRMDGMYAQESTGICLWAWDASKNYTGGDWPGAVMTKTAVADDGYKYFKYEIDTDGTYSIIFVYSDQSKQTGDITNQNGDVAYKITSAESNIVCEKLDAVPTFTKYGDSENIQLCGGTSPLSWNETAPNLTYNSETEEYSYTLTTPSALASGFKIRINNVTWCSSSELNNSAVSTDTYTLSTNTSLGNMVLNDAADYDEITVYVKKNGDNWQIRFEAVEYPALTAKDIESEAEWDNAKFTKNSDGSYSYKVEADLANLNEGFYIFMYGVGEYGGGKITLNGKDDKELASTTLVKDGEALTLYPGESEYIDLTLTEANGTWTLTAVSDQTSGVDALNAEAATISAVDGEIIVNGAQKVTVYTVSGSLISTDVRTQVANGLYIVRADNQVKKVIVK